MTHHDNDHELKEKFWKSMVQSPMVMLQLDADPDSAVPMTAQLDKEGHGHIWFYTTRSNHFAPGGPATCTYASRNHDLFARFHGNLTEETSRERLEKHWSNIVEAWLPGGKEDPNLLMLRMDLGDASIWDSDLGPMTKAKMMLGMDVHDVAQSHHRETRLDRA